ncbi:MAG: ATP synthase F1 subunit delta [Phycisphaerae bacterium]
MAGDFETIQEAAGVYAESLLALAKPAAIEDALAGELDGVAQMVRGVPGFARFLSAPGIDKAARRASIRKLLAGRVHAHVLNLMLVLNDRARSAILPAIRDAYHGLLEKQRGQQRVFVTSAVALTDAERSQLVAALQRIIGRVPLLVERVDAALLGGLRVQYGDRVLDLTLARRLVRMRANLVGDVDRYLHSGRRFVQEN